MQIEWKEKGDGGGEGERNPSGSRTRDAVGLGMLHMIPGVCISLSQAGPQRVGGLLPHPKGSLLCSEVGRGNSSFPTAAFSGPILELFPLSAPHFPSWVFFAPCFEALSLLELLPILELLPRV